MANLVNDTVSWSAGTILFGGSEMYEIVPGSTQDAAPYGVGGNLVAATRYIIFWDKDTPNNFQTIIETSYIESESRVIVFEVTGAPVGGSSQIVARDATYGAPDKLNSESFNKIVAGTFSTGAMTGIVNPTYREGGVVLDSEGLKMWSDTALTGVLPQVSLREETGLSFFQDNNDSYLLARLDANALTFYDGSAVAAANGDRLSQFSSTGLSFFGTDGTTTRATVTPTGVTLTGSAADSSAYGLTIKSNSGSGTYPTSSEQGAIKFETAGGVDVANTFVHWLGSSNYAFATLVYGYDYLINTAGNSLTLTRTGIDLDYDTINADGGYLRFSYESGGSQYDQIWTHTNRAPSWNAGALVTYRLPDDIPATGDYLKVTSGTTASGGTVDLEWAAVTVSPSSTLHGTAVASGSVPTAAYGTFRYATDGGGGTADTLAFASGHTNATPAAATAQSAFWSMLSESDGSTGSNLIFEPIVDYDSTDTTKNRAFIGYHNPLFATYSYYLNGGSGTAAFPSHSFYGDVNTGMYLNSADNIAFSTGGTARIQIYSGGLYPTLTNNYDLGYNDGGGGTDYDFRNIYSVNALSVSSDRRLKEDIQPTNLGLSFINDLTPVSYRWKEKHDDVMDQRHYGIIAQDVVEVLKDHGIDSLEDFGGIVHNGNPEQMYKAKYEHFIPILIKAVQELSEEVKDLKEKL